MEINQQTMGKIACDHATFDQHSVYRFTVVGM